MDALISAAARALAAGDALAALQRVALRDDPPALALRGTALAQLGDLPRARELLRRAHAAFGAHEALARARCVVAEAEVALAMRDVGTPPRPLLTAMALLEARGQHANAQQARLIAVRRLLLLGQLDDAAELLGPWPSGLDAPPLDATHGPPPVMAAIAALTVAELALRSLQPDRAMQALDQAHRAAEQARVPSLQAEVAELRTTLERPAARRQLDGHWHPLRLHDVTALITHGTLVIDACRHGLRERNVWLPMARRPILFTLLMQLAQAWPGDVDRATLIARAFRLRDIDDTHRARLRVELGRLRSLLQGCAGIDATPRGYALRPVQARDVAVLMPPREGAHGALLALLSDGAAWSTSALALALGSSQRTVQRALNALQATGEVRAVGLGRARRWLSPPITGFTPILLLPMVPSAG